MKYLNAFIVQNSCSDKWLNDKMYQLTMCQQHQLLDRQYDSITLSSFDELNNYTNDSKWMFIQSSGDYIIDRDHVWNLLHSLSDDIGMIAHILWDPNEISPHIHRQCIVLNTNALKGRRLDFYNTDQIGYTFKRSEKSFHGNYCPAWVSLDDNEEGPRVSKFGTDVMSLVLENGFKVINFNEDWRNTKNVEYLSHMPSRGYFNPEIDTELFATCFKNLIPNNQLDLAQYEGIKAIKNELEFNVLNVFHWDGIPKGNRCNTIISPANGFMGECIAEANNAGTIIFYDINKNNIDFKKKLYKEWNGEDYESFYKEFARERNLLIDPYSDHAKASALLQMNESHNIISNWKKFKNLEVSFIHCDIIDNIEEILNIITYKSIIHTSTILAYYVWSHINHDLTEIQHVRDLISNRVLETESIWVEA